MRHDEPGRADRQSGEMTAHLTGIEGRLGMHEVGLHWLTGQRNVQYPGNEFGVVTRSVQLLAHLGAAVGCHVSVCHRSILAPVTRFADKVRLEVSVRHGCASTTRAESTRAPWRATSTGLSVISRTSARSSVSWASRATMSARASVSSTGRPRWPNSRGAAFTEAIMSETSRWCSGGMR